MDIALHASVNDADTLIARCRHLGVRHVCLSLGAVPGFADTGVPDRAYLRRFLRRLADAGVEVPVAIAWFGNDPDLVLRPAAHRAEIAAKLHTLAALSDAGIGTLLHYVDVAQSPDPADDARYWDGFLTIFRELIHQAEACDVRLANHAIWRCLPHTLRGAALRASVTWPIIVPTVHTLGAARISSAHTSTLSAYSRQYQVPTTVSASARVCTSWVAMCRRS